MMSAQQNDVEHTQPEGQLALLTQVSPQIGVTHELPVGVAMQIHINPGPVQLLLHPALEHGIGETTTPADAVVDPRMSGAE